MKSTQTPSAPIVGAILVTALLSATPAWAKSNHPSHKAAALNQAAPIQTSAADSHHSNSTGADLAAARAVGAAALMLGGAHGSPSSGGAVLNAPAALSEPTLKSPPDSVTTFSPVPAHPVATRITPYVTVQPPALVVTMPLHRRITTTSVVIPTPYTDVAAGLQVHSVDRIINGPVHLVDRAITGTVDVTQGILPANVVDREIISDDGNHTSAGAAPEPAPGLILTSGVLSLGALAFIRRRARIR